LKKTSETNWKRKKDGRETVRRKGKKTNQRRKISSRGEEDCVRDRGGHHQHAESILSRVGEGPNVRARGGGVPQGGGCTGSYFSDAKKRQREKTEKKGRKLKSGQAQPGEEKKTGKTISISHEGGGGEGKRIEKPRTLPE